MTVETLKHHRVLAPLLERTQLVDAAGGGLGPAAALVLAYELLFGAGLRPAGPAERAVLQRKVRGRAGGWVAANAGECWCECRRM